MKKLPTLILIILISTGAMSAKDPIGVKNGINDKRASETQSKKSILFLSLGVNLSSYLQEEGEWQWGYNLGFTINIHVYKNFSITLPLSYTRINAAPENVEGRTFPDFGENIYKILIDWQVSVGFLEFPILFRYKFYTAKSYDLSYVLGPGLAFATKDFSRIENVTKTDEIIGVEKYGRPLEPQYSLTSVASINTGIRFHVSRFYIDLLYVLYPYEIKNINKLNSISLRLGIDMEQL